jgi:hypothetical protein
MRFVLTIGLVCLIGCDEAPEPTPSPDAPILPTSATTPSSVLADSISGFDAVGNWRLTPSRVGAIEIGLSLTEALPYLETGIDTASIADGCEYVRPLEAPTGVSFMVENRQLVRADVREGDTATPEGVTVGVEERRILELYPMARRVPHKYIDGSYLIVMPFAPADTTRRYVFETDGQRVITFRAGLYPPVEYVEGCS